MKVDKGRACITHRGEEKCIQGFGRKTRKKRLQGRPELDEETILKLILKIERGWIGFIWLRMEATGGSY
jgi:hypothetical protein